jgi:hypothetical protein
MELKDFKKHIESFPNGTKFDFGISEPFSWRGLYAEVAFEMLEQPMTKEEILANIELAIQKLLKVIKVVNTDTMTTQIFILKLIAEVGLMAVMFLVGLLKLKKRKNTKVKRIDL